jgi:hypothetical protein
MRVASLQGRSRPQLPTRCRWCRTSQLKLRLSTRLGLPTIRRKTGTLRGPPLLTTCRRPTLGAIARVVAALATPQAGRIGGAVPGYVVRRQEAIEANAGEVQR